jgi:ABC-type multidrug transport system ATPase subunit
LDAIRADRLAHDYRRLPPLVSGWWPGSSRRRASLRDVSLRVAMGELHLLAGANGAGKSTLLLILAGALAPSSGTIEILGAPVGARETRARVAWLPEASDASSRLTAREAARLQAALYGLARADGRVRAAQMLHDVGLDALADRPLRTLSKGERRRAALAQALVSDPDLLLLDEPLDGVDPESSELLLDLLARRAAAGKAVLLSSHVLLDGRRGGDVLTVLDAGRVVASGPPAAVLRRPEGGEPLSFAELLHIHRAHRAAAPAPA